MLDENNAQCPVARALEVLGDRWALMILRDAFDGLRRFSEFQKNLGLAKNILTSRLKLLVESGLLMTQPASDGSAYKEYVLTDKGRSVFPVVVGLRQWGERFLFEAGEARSELVDGVTGQALEILQVRGPGWAGLTSRRLPAQKGAAWVMSGLLSSPAGLSLYREALSGLQPSASPAQTRTAPTAAGYLLANGGYHPIAPPHS